MPQPGRPGATRARTAIARGLGRLAAERIVTEERLRGLARSPKTVEQVSAAVTSLTARLASTPVSRVKGIVSAMPLQETIAGLLRHFLGSRSAIYTTRDLVSRAVGSLAARRMQDVLRELDLAAILRDRLLPFLGQEANRQTLSRSLGSIVAGQAGKVLSNELIEELARVIDPYVPAVADRLVLWLRSEETRAFLAEKGRVLLPQILEKLNVVQKVLISAGQFDRRLNEKMPEIIDETVKTLEGVVRDPVQQTRIVRVLIEAAEDWRDGLLVVQIDPRSVIADQRKQLGQAIEHLVDRLLATFEDSEARGSVASAVEAWLAGSGQSVGGFLRSIGVRDVELADSLAEKALSWLTREETAQALSRSIADLVSKLLDENPGACHWRGSSSSKPDRKKALDERLTAGIVKLADDHAGDIVARLNLEARIADLVQGVDLGKALESTGMRRAPVKWISLFGALVGFVAGLSQLLLRLVLP